jgi:hypothetical protein
VPLPALAVQGEEAFRSLRARLYGHLESHSSFGQRHGPRRDCSKHAAHRWPHGTGVQRAQRAPWGVWEDRYHASAIEADEHLHRCLVYIDLNMVRAGAVSHPDNWEQSGYREIQKPPKRYAIIDLPILSELSGFADVRDFQTAHRQWVKQTLERGRTVRDDRWSEAIAVGSLVFVESVKSELGGKAMHRGVEQKDGAYTLRERNEAYNGDFSGESEPLRLENTVVWNENLAATET